VIPPFEERLVAARELVNAVRTGQVPELPTYVIDQLRAAAAIAHQEFHQLATAVRVVEPGRNWRESCADPNDDPGWHTEMMARVVVAIADCRSCFHIRKLGPRPAWAVLALRRVDCERCRHTFRRPPADEDDRCDWCGTKGVEVFTPISFQYGPLVVLGDACDDCAAVIHDRRKTG